MLKEKEKGNQADIGSSNQSEENKEQGEMREKLGLMSLLINVLTVGEQDEFTLTELKDTVMAYARGDVPEVVTVLNKEDMDKFNKASALEKVHVHNNYYLNVTCQVCLSNRDKTFSLWIFYLKLNCMFL